MWISLVAGAIAWGMGFFCGWMAHADLVLELVALQQGNGDDE